MTEAKDPFIPPRRDVILPSTEENKGSLVVIPKVLHSCICYSGQEQISDQAIQSRLKAMEAVLSEEEYKFFLTAVRFSTRLENDEDLFIRVSTLATRAKVNERVIRNRLANFREAGIVYEHNSKQCTINGQPVRRRKLYEFIVSEDQISTSVSEVESFMSASATSQSPQQIARNSQIIQREAIDAHKLPFKSLSKKEIEQQQRFVFYEDFLHQFVPYIGDESSGSGQALIGTEFRPAHVNKTRVLGRQKATDYGIVTAKDLQIYYAVTQYAQDYIELNYEFFKTNVFKNKVPISVFKILEYCRKSRNSDINVKDVHTAILRLSTSNFEIKPEDASTSTFQYSQYKYIVKAELLSQTINLGALSKASVSDINYDDPQLQNALNSVYLLTFSDEFVDMMFEGLFGFPFPTLSLKTHPLLFKIYVMLRNTVKESKSSFPWRLFIQRLYLDDVGITEFMDRLLSTMKDIRVLKDDSVSLEAMTSSSYLLKLWGYECYFNKESQHVRVTLDTKVFNESLSLPSGTKIPVVDNKLKNLAVKRKSTTLSLSTPRSEQLESLTDEFKVDMGHYIATPTRSESLSCIELSVVTKTNDVRTFYLDFYLRDADLELLAQEIVHIASLEFSLVMHRLLDIKKELFPITNSEEISVSQFEFNFFIKSSPTLRGMNARQRYQLISLLDLNSEVRRQTLEHYLATEEINDGYLEELISGLVA